MISTSNISLRVGKKALFEEVNIKFTEGNCYGLIGAVSYTHLMPGSSILYMIIAFSSLHMHFSVLI